MTVEMDPAVELPHEPDPSVPLWSENFCYQAYDSTSRVGFWLHLGSITGQPGQWRQIFVAYLPDGDVLVEKSWGRRQHQSGPGATSMTLSCDKPFQTFTIDFDGSAQRCSTASLVDRFRSDGLNRPTKAQLVFDARTPLWAAGEQMTKQAWGHIHHEQLCRVTGWLEHDSQHIAIDGNGIRDHTVGPRDFEPIRRHCWISGISDSGRGFVLLAMESREGVAKLQRGFVYIDGELHQAEPVEIPYLCSLDDRDQYGPLTLRYGDHTARITAEVLHNVSYGLIPPNEVTVGFDPAVATNLVVEGQTRFDWDGEVLYGLTERSLVVSR